MFNNQGRRAMDRAPFTSRMTVAWLNLRHAIRNDPDRNTSVIIAAGLIGVLIVACTR